jgi:selenophosphate synthase
MIPEDLKSRAASRADSMGLSLGGFIRESLERVLKSDAAKTLDDPFWADNAVYEDDAVVDLAKNHDQYLYGPNQ